MLPIKSSEVPPAPPLTLHCQPSTPALPVDAPQQAQTAALREECETQPERKLHGPARVLSLAPAA